MGRRYCVGTGSMGDENFPRLTLGVKLRSIGIEFADMLKQKIT